jgi:hypothetical protein
MDSIGEKRKNFKMFLFHYISPRDNVAVSKNEDIWGVYKRFGKILGFGKSCRTTMHLIVLC